MEKFVIIDGNNLLFRAFYALPQLRNFEGEISNGVFGFANMLIKVITEQKPAYIAVAFDKGKNTFRHKKYAEYKAQRKPTPSELIEQFPILKNMLKLMGVAVLEHDDIEADDIIGILSRKFETQNIIVSADKDVLQLINDNTHVLSPKKGISETFLYTIESLKETMGISPLQIIDLKALMGDVSDNIPGVAGVGEITAKNLIEKYQSLEGVYSNIENEKGKLKEKLITGKEDAFLSKELATIAVDYPLNVELNEFKYEWPLNNEVKEFFKKYQFNSLLKKDEYFKVAEGEAVREKPTKKIKIVDIKNVDNCVDVANNCLKLSEVAVYIKPNCVAVYDGSVEYRINCEQNLLGENCAIDDVLVAFKKVFESLSVKKVLFNSKADMHVLDGLGITLNNYYDILIARYLINSNAKSKVEYQEVLLENGLNEKMLASGLIDIKKNLDEKLEKFELVELFEKVELPLAKVLFEMEKQGFKIDLEELNLLDQKYSKIINELTEEIYDLAGCEFNINSPKQVAQVLFEYLGLKHKPSSKNSTAVDVLKDMVGLHPVVAKIIEYRQYSKFQSTYINAFKDLVDKNSCKLYTTFNQTLTATGRISSSEPNLQNIPVRSEEGKSIRKIFVSSFEDGYIVSADYSQIELRLLANFSKDDILLSAFKNNEDIHARTASEIFGVPIDLVSDEMRRSAKAINFGIIYGISDFGLSQNIGTTRNVAKQYISAYFDKYPKINEYIQKNVDDCKNLGYAKTFMNRIRIVPEINSSNYNLRQFGERVAMNMPLQGGASDIIKLAMINVFNRFNEKKLKSKLMLQVHDELVVDVQKDELEQVCEILKEEMENVVQLDVELKVDIEYGRNWKNIE